MTEDADRGHFFWGHPILVKPLELGCGTKANLQEVIHSSAVQQVNRQTWDDVIDDTGNVLDNVGSRGFIVDVREKCQPDLRFIVDVRAKCHLEHDAEKNKRRHVWQIDSR